MYDAIVVGAGSPEEAPTERLHRRDHPGVLRAAQGGEAALERERGRNMTTRTNHSKTLVVLAALIFALALAVLAGMAAKPAEAAFPGMNGKIVFASQRTAGEGVDNPTGDYEIFTMNPDGSGVVQLTFNTAEDNEPAISPNGAQITFHTNRDGNYEIYTMGTGGSNQINRTNSQGSDFRPAYSADGQRIAFDTTRTGNHEIFTMGADGSNPTNRTNNPKTDLRPAWSPNGRKIAFQQQRYLYGERRRFQPDPHDQERHQRLRRQLVA
jgi:Tol biopolymer transport system component